MAAFNSTAFFAVSLLSLLLLFNGSFAEEAGHFEDYTFTFQTVVNRCSPYSYQSCSGFWWWKSCSTINAENCYNVVETQSKTNRRCQAGWLEPACTTAICTPPCTDGKVCMAPPQTCECLRSGGGDCTNVACPDVALDCYPGTCAASGSSCMCPPGFSGLNCESVNLRAKVSSCLSRVYAGSPETVVAKSDCTAEDIPASSQWLSTKTPSRLQVTWRAEFSAQPMLLPRVNYVNSQVLVGIVNAFFTVAFPGTKEYTSPLCVEDSWASPFSFQTCDSTVPWSDIGLLGLLIHGAQFNVSTFSQSGAQKTGDVRYTGGDFGTRRMTGLTTRTYMSFSVDLVSPTHCLLGNPVNNQQCTCFPVYMEQDITTNPIIQPLVCGWSDDMSGLARYHVEVYLMQPGGDGTLEETRTPVHSEDILPPYNSFRYTCVQSGVYSIQLTVYDNANNTARARKLFNYDGNSVWKVDQTVKVHIAEADPSTDYKWINNLVTPADGICRLTVVWSGRYKNDAKYGDIYLKAASPWRPQGSQCTTSYNCIDDAYPNRFGQRTINAISSNSTILLNYWLLYEVDSNGGVGLIDPPAQNTTVITAEQKTLLLPKFQNGDSVVVWFTSVDFVGNMEKFRITVSLDRTKPVSTGDAFATKTYDEFTSSVFMNIKDLESGIKQINYTIYDVTLRQPIFSKTDPAVKFSQAVEGRKRRAVEKQCPPEGDDTCYCLNTTGECYASTQYINIENCVFDRYIQDTLEFKYTVTNQAGLSISGSIMPTTEQLKDVRCRPKDDTGLSAGAKAGIGIGVTIPSVLLIIVLVLLIWHWRKYQHPLPRRVRTFYNRTFRHKHIRETDNPVYTSRGARDEVRAPSAHKKEVPSVPRTVKINNIVDEEYGTTGEEGGIKVNHRQVQTDKTLVEGKFAVVKRGTVTVNNECLPVAVKALKRGFTAADRTLMDQKISFLSGISSHINIVKFIASYDDGLEGPAMLLELCDLPLKDWLSQHSNITAETLDEILNFILDIAQGVQHLHSRHVIHRRLAVRNVLLKRQRSDVRAKLIGFGPSAEDMESGFGGNEEVTRPVRWLAPEILDTMKSKNPKYNNKTDSWSFGITVWEMYSKGQKPYPGNEQKEIKGLLQRGYRMDCPKDCPPDLFRSVVAPCWNSSARKRPEFDVMCSTIVKFRGSGQQEDYYAAEQSDSYSNMQQDNTMYTYAAK